MSEQMRTGARVFVYAVALFAAATGYPATAKTIGVKHVAPRHAAAKTVLTNSAAAKIIAPRHAAARPIAARHVAAKDAAAKAAAAKEAAAKKAAARDAAAKAAAAKKAAAKKTAAKDAAAKKAAAKNAPLAVSLKRLAGSWKGDKSGLKVKIEQGAIGWEAWLSTDGQARITQPEANPQIIKIQSRNITCTYTVTLPGAQTMKWESAPGQPASRCLGDSFTKLGLAPAKVRPLAPAKPAVPAKPPAASIKQP